MERSKLETKNEVPKAKTIAQAYFPLGSLRPKTVDEIPNYFTPIVHPLSPGGDNINKHYMVIFYKTWKKCHEIQLTKNKMDMKK